MPRLANNPTSDQSQQPVTTTQLAAEFGVDPSAVRRWVESGKITPALTTPGGHYRFDLPAVKRELQAGRRNGADIEPEGSITLIENNSGRREIFVTGSEWEELLARHNDHDAAVKDDGVEELRCLAGDEAAVDPNSAVAEGDLSIGPDLKVPARSGVGHGEGECEGAPINSAFADQLMHCGNGLGSEASFEAIANTDGSKGHERSPVVADSEPGRSDDPAEIVQEATNTTPGVGAAAGSDTDTGPAASSQADKPRCDLPAVKRELQTGRRSPAALAAESEAAAS